MKKILFTTLCILLFSQISFAESCNIAVVDLQKVVDNSAQVKTLKNEHSAKIKELNGIITKAQEEIAKQINKSVRTVKTYMAEMQEKGLIERKNGKKNGEWVVN